MERSEAIAKLKQHEAELKQLGRVDQESQSGEEVTKQYVDLAARLKSVTDFVLNKWLPKPAAPVTTKDCPQCAMPIPLAAKKCGHCTSAV